MKLKVKAGSLCFEQGTFQQGDIITVTEERARLFDKNDVEFVVDPIMTVPIPVSEPEKQVETMPAAEPAVQSEPSKRRRRFT